MAEPQTPPSAFDAELLGKYLDVVHRSSAGADASFAAQALFETLEARLDVVARHAQQHPAARVALGLTQRVVFEIVQQLARSAELGNARTAAARLLGRSCLFEPLAHERFSITQDWFSGNIAVWQRLFAELSHKPGLRCLEIGSYEGLSACWLLENVLTHETSRIICIDPFDAPGQLQAERHFDRNVAATGLSHKLTKLKGFSKQALPLLAGSRFDIAYIDGSHHPTHVLEDALAVWPLLEPGALLVFDDYELGASYPPELAREADPKPGIDAFLRFVTGQYREVERGYQLAIRKS
ncbi:MAG: class I SAM-dependent methyltransferase [Polyangiaceae bacterium]